MAQGFLQSFNKNILVCSAGTEPSAKIHTKAIQVMQELGIDISKNNPKSVNEFLNESFDYVITVCDTAKETCPMFTGKVKHHIHIGFDDPSLAKGTEEYIMTEFRRIRNEIKDAFISFNNQKIRK